MPVFRQGLPFLRMEVGMAGISLATPIAAGGYPDKVQPTTSDFRSRWAFALTDIFKMGRKPFIHSPEIILQSNYHWER